MTDKYLINCQHGGDDLEKATVAMIVAGAASAMDGDTAWAEGISRRKMRETGHRPANVAS